MWWFWPNWEVFRFLSDISISTLIFWFLFGSLDLKPLPWNSFLNSVYQNNFSYFFFHFRVLTLSTLITFFSNFGLRYSNWTRRKIFKISNFFSDLWFWRSFQKFWSYPFFNLLVLTSFRHFGILTFSDLRTCQFQNFRIFQLLRGLDQFQKRSGYFSWKRRLCAKCAKRSEPTVLESQFQEFWSDLIFWTAGLELTFFRIWSWTFSDFFSEVSILTPFFPKFVLEPEQVFLFLFSFSTQFWSWNLFLFF